MDRKQMLQDAMPRKAVALFSGGGDSMLAAALVRGQGIDVLALNFSTCFFLHREEDAVRLSARCRSLGLEFRSVFLGEEYMRMLAAPKHGYGNAFNPCIDCHTMMLRSARGIMAETGAEFAITGEVLGQRPMSQNKQALAAVERESGLRGRLLRPLSAKLLPPTIAELRGTVDRGKLLDIQGRSRKRQIELAARLGIEELPGAAGGCALTEPAFGKRVRDIYENASGGIPGIDDALLLRLGRHLRRSPDFKIVVGKNRIENDELISLAKPGDLLFMTPDVKRYVGPVALARGSLGAPDREWIAAVVLRYADVEAGKLETVAICDHAGKVAGEVEALPMDPELVRRFMI